MTASTIHETRPISPTTPDSSDAASPEGSSTPLPEPLTPHASIDDLIVSLEGLVAHQNSVDTKDGTDRYRAVAKAKTESSDEKVALEVKQYNEQHDVGSGFFGSIGEVARDELHDAIHLHVEAMVNDGAKDVSHAVNSRQFWQDLTKGATEVGKWAAVAASTATAVVTCGAASAGAVAVTLAVVGAAATTAGAVEGDAHVLNKLGVCDDKTDGYVSLGLSLGGAACSLGGSVGAAAPSAGASGTNGSSSAMNAESAERAATVAKNNAYLVGQASQATNATAGAATAVGGGAQMVTAQFDARDVRTQRDLQLAQEREQWLSQALQGVLAEMKAEHESATQKTEAVDGLATSAQQTQATILTGMKA